MTFDLVPRTLEDQQAWLARPRGRPPGHRRGRRRTSSWASGRCRPTATAPPTRRPSRTRCTCAATDGATASGRLLLAELVALATTHGFHSVIGRIVGGHEASIALHRACGFEQAGVEREVGRKFGRWLDVVLMQKLL